MFLIRSAFWLMLAFVVIKPFGMDIPGVASAAVASGQISAVQMVEKIECTSVECAGAKLLASAALKPSTATTGKSASLNAPVPMPRPNRRS